MKIIKLKKNNYTATVAPELGGSILSFDAEFLGCERAVLRSTPNTSSILETASFPLVPFSNRIRNGKFEWLDETVQLPLNFLPEKHSIHGQGWQSKWSVVSQTSYSVTIEYRHKGVGWPFLYTSQQVIELTEEGLQVAISIKNTGNVDMPVGLGFHPYFTRTPDVCLKASVSEMWDVDEEFMPTKIIDAPLSLSSSSGLRIAESTMDNTLINRASSAEVIWPEWKIKATISSSENCPFLVLYTPKDEDFFCVEPTSHCTDAINMQAKGVRNSGMKTLAVGTTMNIWMKIVPQVCERVDE